MLSAQEIMKIIPHRYPFLLIDRVIELEAGRKIWQGEPSERR